MNQILITKNKKYKNFKNNKNKKFFKIQFTISSIIIIILLFFLVYYFFSLRYNEYFSKNLINNYEIYKLYSKNYYAHNNNFDNNLFGIIEISKINIYYPIFSNLSDEKLKKAPCKFYGDSLDKNDNICIAGHNYDNSMFFSKISKLNIDDEIIIYDNTGKIYIYYVTSIYEVSSSDLSPVLDYNHSQKNLTLVTCNNFNSNRIILRAKQKSS